MDILKKESELHDSNGMLNFDVYDIIIWYDMKVDFHGPPRIEIIIH